jgi:hypothetical protein
LGVAPFEGLKGLPQADGKAANWQAAARGGLRESFVTMVETLRLALDALRSHKLRSFLTLLGVILAVTTLVVVMSVVAGLNFYVADKVANLDQSTEAPADHGNRVRTPARQHEDGQ